MNAAERRQRRDELGSLPMFHVAEQPLVRAFVVRTAPCCCLVLLYFVFFAFFACIIFIGIFAPKAYTSGPIYTTLQLQDNSSTPQPISPVVVPWNDPSSVTLLASTGPLTPLNQEVFLYLDFSPSTFARESKIDFSLRVWTLATRVEFCQKKDLIDESTCRGDWKIRTESEEGVETGVLVNCYCSSRITSESGKAGKKKISKNPVRQTVRLCDPLMVFHDVAIGGSWSFGEADVVVYRYVLEFAYQSEFVDSLLSGTVGMSAEFVSGAFSYVEVAYRYFFLVMDIVLIFVFWFRIVGCRCAVRNFRLEQVVVFALLLGLIAFNNPFFVANIVVGGVVLAVLNLAFKAAFYALFLYCLLIFSHLLYQRPSEIDRSRSRACLLFCGPKILVSGFVFCALSSYFVVTFLHHREAFHYSSYLRTDFYRDPLEMVTLVSLVIYAILLTYYVERTCALCGQKPCLDNRRIWIVYSLTIILVVVLILVYVALLFFDLYSDTVGFLAYQFVFNGIVDVLVVLFMPSSKLEQQTVEFMLINDEDSFESEVGGEELPLEEEAEEDRR